VADYGLVADLFEGLEWEGVHAEHADVEGR